MDFALLISTALTKNPNAPPAAIINKPKTTIGRHADIKMDTTRTHEVSKHHAKILYEEFHGKNSWVIEDNLSLNGTFLNCKKIKKHVLKEGDELVFGGGSCFYYGDQIAETNSAECRYIFLMSDRIIEFAKNSNKDLTMSELENNEDCCICYMPIGMKSTLSCGHSFCRKCLSSWGMKCAKKEIPFVCPVCRHEFDPSQAIIPSVQIENNICYIYDIEPFLKITEISSLKELEDLSIFNKWTEDDRQKFWTCFEKISGKNKKQIIFRKVTNTTFRDVINADEQQLENAGLNFQIDEVSHDNLRQEILRQISVKIYHKGDVKPVKSNDNNSVHQFQNY